jgi:hypothetical protein
LCFFSIFVIGIVVFAKLLSTSSLFGLATQTIFLFKCCASRTHLFSTNSTMILEHISWPLRARHIMQSCSVSGEFSVTAISPIWHALGLGRLVLDLLPLPLCTCYCALHELGHAIGLLPFSIGCSTSCVQHAHTLKISAPTPTHHKPPSAASCAVLGTEDSFWLLISFVCFCVTKA